LFDDSEYSDARPLSFDQAPTSKETVSFRQWLDNKTPPQARGLGNASSFVDESIDSTPPRGQNDFDVEEVRREGYLEGVEQSRRQIQAIEDQYEARLASLGCSVADRVAALERAVVRRVNETAVAIAEAMAQTIVRAELEARPERLLGAVQDILGRATGLGEVSIRVHPDAAEHVEAHLDRLRLESETAIDGIVADPDLTLGDVRVVGTAGSIDALLDERMSQLADLARTELGFMEVDMIDEVAREITEASDQDEV
jgi:flagellar biosynthesis/type III secretory pathway protein FliH